MENKTKILFIYGLCGYCIATVLWRLSEFIYFILNVQTYRYYLNYTGFRIFLYCFSHLLAMSAALALLVFVATAAFEDFAQLKSKIKAFWFVPGAILILSAAMNLAASLASAPGAAALFTFIFEFVATVMLAAGLYGFFPKLLMEKFTPVTRLKKDTMPLQDPQGIPGFGGNGFQPQESPYIAGTPNGFPAQAPLSGGVQPQADPFRNPEVGYQPQPQENPFLIQDGEVTPVTDSSTPGVSPFSAPMNGPAPSQGPAAPTQ